MSKRVCCLYRVSTGKQVDYDSNNEADIPMQRKACHKFASKMGWNIVHEEQEDGVSGHKVRAENRDKIQIIKDLARKKKFDILLVFLFVLMFFHFRRQPARNEHSLRACQYDYQISVRPLGYSKLQYRF